MRALFALLLIFFLTGALQITGNNTFAKKAIGFNTGTDTTEIECIVSGEIGLSESLLENLEDQDNKITAFALQNTLSESDPASLACINKGKINTIFQSVLIFYTNLPPPC
nr:hypothetical protein [uncultured Draconibacterium sp.]